MTRSHRAYRGQLIDLAPDGLGFIIPADNPNAKLPFRLRDPQHRTFEEAGLVEGAIVEFRLNERHQIEHVTPVG